MKNRLLKFVLVILIMCVNAFVFNGCFHKHNYTTQLIEPTCTEQGYEAHICKCGYVIKDNYVDKLEHVLQEVSNNDGTLSNKCQCGFVESVIVDEKAFIIKNNALKGLTTYGQTLSKIIVPNMITIIEGYVFRNAYDLKTVIVPNSVTVIDDSAFYKCTSLISVTLGNSVETIGDYAFKECKNLTSIVIPKTVTSIGSQSFYKCYSLTNIKYCGTESQWNKIDKGSYWHHDKGSVVIDYNYLEE